MKARNVALFGLEVKVKQPTKQMCGPASSVMKKAVEVGTPLPHRWEKARDGASGEITPIIFPEIQIWY